MVLLDFAKAYDSILWDNMAEILRKFNFGIDYIKWVELCYSNITSTVINSGLSEIGFTLKKRCEARMPFVKRSFGIMH